MAIPFVYARASGSRRDIGRQIGEAAREQICASLAFFGDELAAMSGGALTFAQAREQAHVYLEHARRHVPDCVAELEGMAEGAGVDFADLLVPNCGEEFTSSEPVEGQPRPRRLAPGAQGGDHCTAVAVVAGGRHIVGHNMDWYVIDAANNVLFDLTLRDGTRILSIAGAAYLPMLGMNSHGVGNVSNSVYSADNRIGVPNAFVRRHTLDAHTLDDARARGLLEARARGTNHFLADTGGRLWDIETSARTSAFMDHTATGFMAHTNHYVAAEMAAVEGASQAESRLRLGTAERLLAEGLARGDDPVELVARVLRCHEPDPAQAICGHPDESRPLADQGMTVGSMVCDLDERRLYACAGPPCENPYQVFEMD